MRRHHMPEVKEGGINVTPLIDVVMVLIVFFMLVAKIGVTRGTEDDIPLPAALLGVNEMKDLSPTLTLNLRKSGNEREPLITALVKDQMRELHVQKKYASGTDEELERVLTAHQQQWTDKAVVIIHAERDLPYRQLEPVLIACAQAKIGNIAYETT